ncbi:MAG: NADH-quinone oxidoreductase subunit J [Cyanobacteriota bacterium]
MKEIIITISFYILAFLSLLGAMGVVFNKKIVNSGLMLLLCFLSIAGLFLLLNADFVAMAQILVYSVGIAIIVIFAIMLTNPNSTQADIFKRPRSIISLISCFFLMILMFMAIFADPFIRMLPSGLTTQRLIEAGTSGIIGKALFTVYVLPFEIISILLLVAIIGAVLLARRDIEKIEEE